MLTPLTSPLGNFAQSWRAVDRPELVAPPVAAALAEPGLAESAVLVVDTDPELADTANFCAAYAVAPEESANCVVVAAKRGQSVTLVACVVLASTRADVNGLVRKHFEARKASFAAMEVAVAGTGMEYGGITPIGLPADWPLLIDERVAGTPFVIIGSGLRRGKLIAPGKVLATLPGAQVLSGLGI
jgi:prolyl-tRNA editing enzyme YbaK/EbsC (Cys-tRNA(Pro) deacylase)